VCAIERAFEEQSVAVNLKMKVAAPDLASDPVVGSGQLRRQTRWKLDHVASHDVIEVLFHALMSCDLEAVISYHHQRHEVPVRK
jgi:hypothetical protein